MERKEEDNNEETRLKKRVGVQFLFKSFTTTAAFFFLVEWSFTTSAY